MKKNIIALGALAALSACANDGVYNRVRPDEFAVARNEPLAMPADYSLPTPQPGAARPQAEDTKAKVLDALFGGPAPK